MKTYEAYWGDDFFESGTRTEPEDFFCADNCYEPEDIAAIQALQVGETWLCPDYGHHHTVTRLT